MCPNRVFIIVGPCKNYKQNKYKLSQTHSYLYTINTQILAYLRVLAY